MHLQLFSRSLLPHGRGYVLTSEKGGGVQGHLMWAIALPIVSSCTDCQHLRRYNRRRAGSVCRGWSGGHGMGEGAAGTAMLAKQLAGMNMSVQEEPWTHRTVEQAGRRMKALLGAHNDGPALCNGVVAPTRTKAARSLLNCMGLQLDRCTLSDRDSLAVASGPIAVLPEQAQSTADENFFFCCHDAARCKGSDRQGSRGYATGLHIR